MAIGFMSFGGMLTGGEEEVEKAETVQVEVTNESTTTIQVEETKETLDVENNEKEIQE